MFSPNASANSTATVSKLRRHSRIARVGRGVFGASRFSRTIRDITRSHTHFLLDELIANIAWCRIFAQVHYQRSRVRVAVVKHRFQRELHSEWLLRQPLCDRIPRVSP